MLSSWLRSPKASSKRPAPYRPALESLDARICPTSPHFISATASVDSGTGALVVDFKEAGLGTNQLINYEVDATATGQYQWFNHGGNKPQGQPFQFGPITVSGTGSFDSGKNGNVTASITVSPPPPDQAVLDAGAGKNWTLELTITWSNITLTDTTTPVTTAVIPDHVGPVTVIVPT
jgi:hypothetical protein